MKFGADKMICNNFGESFHKAPSSSQICLILVVIGFLNSGFE